MFSYKYVELNDDGTLKRVIGTYQRITSHKGKVYFWASLHLDYCGG